MNKLKMFLKPSFWSKAILVTAVTFFAACSDDDPSYGSLDSDGDGVANGQDAFPRMQLNPQMLMAMALAIMPITA